MQIFQVQKVRNVHEPRNPQFRGPVESSFQGGRGVIVGEKIKHSIRNKYNSIVQSYAPFIQYGG